MVRCHVGCFFSPTWLSGHSPNRFSLRTSPQFSLVFRQTGIVCIGEGWDGEVVLFVDASVDRRVHEAAWVRFDAENVEEVDQAPHALINGVFGVWFGRRERRGFQKDGLPSRGGGAQRIFLEVRPNVDSVSSVVNPTPRESDVVDLAARLFDAALLGREHKLKVVPNPEVVQQVPKSLVEVGDDPEFRCLVSQRFPPNLHLGQHVVCFRCELPPFGTGQALVIELCKNVFHVLVEDCLWHAHFEVRLGHHLPPPVRRRHRLPAPKARRRL
mmetsp:Transcript_21067/g.41754  ORF Transcript_21067/g.41754 Transcript_21067/m.41754 type:complete len:270 (-) Transcript_21067:497-1306(-)